MASTTERNLELLDEETERLRALLDERGVEYETYHDAELTCVFWNDRNGQPCSALDGADDIPEGMLSVQCVISSEQAVEATLGRGECRFRTVERFIDARRSRADMCECDRCGYRCARGFIQDERFKYCPNCGSKVVAE